MGKGPCRGRTDRTWLQVRRGRPRFQSQIAIPALLLTGEHFHGTQYPLLSCSLINRNGGFDFNLTKGRGAMREQLGNASGLTTLTGLHIHLSSTEGQCACQMAA